MSFEPSAPHKMAIAILKYLHKNAWTIVFIIAACYFCYIYIIEPIVDRYRTERSYREATDPNRVAVLSPDMRRIRAKQQEVAIRRAAEAEEERKLKAKVERERKRVKSPEEERWERLGGEGTRLGNEEGMADDADSVVRTATTAAGASSTVNPWGGMRRRTAGR